MRKEAHRQGVWGKSPESTGPLQAASSDAAQPGAVSVSKVQEDLAQRFLLCLPVFSLQLAP